MPRHPIDLKRSIKPIKGAAFTIRTFTDGEFGIRGPINAHLDRLVTITLPAIDGEDREMAPTMEVKL